ncbi:MAG: MDR family MFS transporter [Thermoleophilia bacterium]
MRNEMDSSVYPLGRRRTLVVLGAVVLGMLLASINQTIVATALPTIAADLGGLDHYSWVFSAYMLGSTISIPLYGKLSDVHGRRPLFLIGIGLFAVGSIAAALAPSMGVLVAARTVQGIGAGGLIPLGVAVIGDVIPPRERGRWQSLLGVVFAGSNVAGPAIGGSLADDASWRLAFVVSLPLAAAAAAAMLLGFVDVAERRPSRIDWRGSVLLVGATSAGLLAAVWGGQDYAWTSPVIVSLLVAAAALGVAFARHERREPDPLIPPRLLRLPAIARADIALFAVGAAAFGAILFLPLFVQEVLGTSATRAGAVLTPFMLSWIAASIVAGQIVSRTGRVRPVLLAGPPTMAVGFVLLMLMGPGTGIWSATGYAMVLGVGIGLVMQTLVIVVQNAAPRGTMGVVTATAQFSRSIGQTVGAALMGAIVNAGLASDVTDAAPADLADALQPAFAAGIGLAAIALVAIAALPRIELRARVPGRAPSAAAARAR